LGEFSPIGQFNFRSSPIFGDFFLNGKKKCGYQLCRLLCHKEGCATFWAIFSQTHLVTLDGHGALTQCRQADLCHNETALCKSFSLPLPHCHYHIAITTLPLPHCHYHIAINTLALPYCHYHIAITTLSLPHYH
jgi:hypothetical protein